MLDALSFRNTFPWKNTLCLHTENIPPNMSPNLGFSLTWQSRFTGQQGSGVGGGGGGRGGGADSPPSLPLASQALIH